MADETTTQQPMTDKRLADIRERVGAATPGPWYAQSYFTGDDDWRVSLHEEERESVKLTETQRRQRWFVATSSMRRVDSEFVAHSREDIPALLAEVERLRAELEDARGDIAFLERSRKTASERAAAAMEIVRRVAEGHVMCACGMVTFPVNNPPANNYAAVPVYDWPIHMPANNLAPVPVYGMTTVIDICDIQHREECPIAQARAMPAPTPGAQEGEGK